MEELVGFVVWILFNLVFEVLGEFILEFTRNLSEEDTPASVAVGWFSMIGLAFGTASVLVATERVLRSGPFIGVSVLLAPILVGVVMALWGDHRRKQGRAISHLATWYGGASMGLGLAVGRLGALAAMHEL